MRAALTSDAAEALGPEPPRRGRSLLFYSQWALGFHNPEAERKAFALGDVGYEVVYVPGTGLRNPRLARAGKVVEAGRQKLHHRSRTRTSPSHARLATASMLVTPPRQIRAMRRLNAAWMRRQLQAIIPSWPEVLAWIRYPTPELVDALEHQPPRAVVYECVDSYHHTPGVVGAWVERFHRAERALIDLAQLVVTPGEALASRFQSLGARVRVVPHGVDPEAFRVRGPDRTGRGPTTAGFVGTLDPRLDVAAVRLVAERHPEWRIRLIGPVRDGFEPRSVTSLPNVTVEPPIPHESLGEVLASFDAGLMPYLDRPHYRYMCPVKNLEFMAAGKPAVARPNRALMRSADLLYFARTPEEFCAQLERALAEDSSELAWRRRAVAEANSWQRRLGEIQDLAVGLASP